MKHFTPAEIAAMRDRFPGHAIVECIALEAERAAAECQTERSAT